MLCLKAPSALPQLWGWRTSGGTGALWCWKTPASGHCLPLILYLWFCWWQAARVCDCRGVPEELLSLMLRRLLTSTTLFSSTALRQQRASCRKGPAEAPALPLPTELGHRPVPSTSQTGGSVTPLKQGQWQQRLQGCWPRLLEAARAFPGPQPCGFPCLVCGGSRYPPVPQGSQEFPSSSATRLVSSTASPLVVVQPPLCCTPWFPALCFLVFAIPGIVCKNMTCISILQFEILFTWATKTITILHSL